jgi:uncharacterized OB-fold protein
MSDDAANVPLPRPDPANEDDAAFWDALRTGELRIQRCASCGVLRHPPRPVCAHCGSTDRGWQVVRGTGEVWSFTVVYPPTLPAFAARTPYGAVVVRLDEGVFLVSNIVDCPVDELQVGIRVELVLTRIAADQAAGGDLVLPYFRRS